MPVVRCALRNARGFRVLIGARNCITRSGKSNFVPIIFSAMVLFQGKPFAEPEDGSRLIDILVRAGATADPYGTEALVARAEQCEWSVTVTVGHARRRL